MIGMIYNVLCAKDRNYTYHTVEDDEDGVIQTIKCVICGHVQINDILSRLESVEKRLNEECEKHAG